jgi:hypothetical protein
MINRRTFLTTLAGTGVAALGGGTYRSSCESCVDRQGEW